MAVVIILAAIALLVIGYIFYGSWLAKQWGIDPARKTPAYTMSDGVDYVAAKPAVLMGHHFSSIAGAGPINGPIQAAVFGWVPVFLWCVIGGIFFGGVHDFGALFASARHDGKSVGEIIGDTMGKKAKTLFLIFALLVLILVIASFVNVVAGTFAAPDDAKGLFATGAALTGTETTAMISMLFIVLAVIYGLLTNRAGLGTLPATILGLIGIVVIVYLGLKVGLVFNRTTWIFLIGLYITIASLVPVWILLQPRDYLSSYLLYVMMGIAVGYHLLRHFRLRHLPDPRLHRLEDQSGRPVPGSVHHRGVRRLLRLPLPDRLRHHRQAAGQRGPRPSHRLRRHADRVRSGHHLPDRCGHGLLQVRGR